ncbi:MAG: hypothetical protein GW839_00925 [Flavobacteriales bacterium]|nr:hypothetical protein [Flavobacteriia bacterium]NCP07160.1 hypothetical protein [Flavobacteriales bacterium]PIV93443.1 MAG: hypothetical protein COW44_09250 [Flavobacteriaceae bacterium CG17_big_fil_post_rev_8_21_14_2_50_33_15]PIY12884.1 MAG: hypothetical protein COZ17_02250 [Flavobacteriaceae bacterium CG_4_10_14_3_um_filter_33_47]PJB18424.1 MAG: hypothetical protein CO117_08140 [Flavobacteriaceae bacterium CG_4_9_14_3_um_filter_33_16]
MKKKLSIIITILSISSIINLNAKTEIKDAYTCWDVADATVDTFNEANLKMRHIATYEQQYRIWEAAYDGCMGE